MKEEKPAFDLVAINPTMVFGAISPHLSKGELSSINTSNQRILDMLEGKMKDKLAPTGFHSWVDAEDVALAHVRALQVPEASGKRFLMLTDHFTNKAIAQIIASMGPEFKEKLPSNLDSLEEDLPGPNELYEFNSQRVVDILGVKYTSLDKSVKDTVESMLKLGA